MTSPAHPRPEHPKPEHPRPEQKLSPEDEEQLADQRVAAAASRVAYRLTYAAAPTNREVHSMGIAGPALPNSYFVMGGPVREDGTTRPERGSGDWEDPDHGFAGWETTEDQHIERWAQSAVYEAVHEALEWFWADGRPWLDPHGQAEARIHEACERFGAELAELRRQVTGGGEVSA
jgi:hypothetical protein